MALVDTTWYCNSVGYAAVPVWTTAAIIAAGALRRQTAPAVGNERVFICIVAGTTGGVEPTWVLTRGTKTTDNTVTWQECTGQAALNGDLTNTATWAQVKAATPAVLGQIIKRSNNASYQICTTAGAMSASEPTFSDTAGVTTTDTTAVWSSLGVVGNFTGGQAPFARLASACTTTWFAIGNTVYVADNHAESQATAITIAPTLFTTTVGKILCHNHSGGYPPAAGDLTTGATISTTGAVNLTFNPTSGTIYVYGLSFISAVGQSTSGFLILAPASAFYYFDNCIFKIATTNVAAQLQLNAGTAGSVVFNNVTVSFAAIAQYIDVGNTIFTWQNTGAVLVSGSSVPNNLLGNSGTGRIANVTLEALDLSQLTGGLWQYNVVFAFGAFIVKDCKLNASFAVATPQAFSETIQLVRSDSGATAYKSARYQYEGTETTETTIVRTGGAVDPNGQAQSRKIVTTANAQWLRPFKAEPYASWNTVTGATVTVTVYGTINAGAVPNNDDIWLEVEYLGSSATPIGTIITTTKASVLANNAAVASDGSSWNGGGSGAGWLPFKLVATITPGMAGVIEARIRAAKASTTYYIDPQPVLI